MDREVLPSNVRPIHYDLKLTPDLQACTFSGEVTVTITVAQPTQTISVNCNEVEISRATVENPVSKALLTATSISHEKAKETTKMTFPEELPVGEHRLFMAFTGILNDQMAGFYRSEYSAPNGEKRNMATTQFEATDARRAFPCWDEPALKATFKVTLVVPVDRVALSNMEVEKTVTSADGKLKEIVFGVSPIMSTYLLAFVVGELDFIEGHTPTGVRVRVYTPVGESEKGKFGLDVGIKTLALLEEYFDEKYPLPKLDMVAIPDFSAGAMENWGLVTYRTMYILYDEKESSLDAKQTIAYIVGHELAHQWFGNLVTMEWWTDLWLNEGFATWVGWMVVDKLFPEWNIWTQFLINEQHLGLKLDGMKSSHPIEVDVKNPSEITQVFDAISYSKGACIIRMLVNFLGFEVFLKGVRAYLKKYKYKNASTKDLWESLSEASGHNVGEFMYVWTRKMGYPVVTLEHTGQHDGCVKATQARFLATGKPKPEDDTETWWVPLAPLTNEGVNTAHTLLKDKEAVLQFDPKRSFLKLNSAQNGFYRVAYSEADVIQLKAALASKSLGDSDRVGLANDAFALAFAGYTSTSRALSLLQAYRDETNFVVWDDISSSLATLNSLLSDEDAETQERVVNFIRSLFSPLTKRLGWEYPENEAFNETSLRGLVIPVAGRAKDPEVLAEARKRFESLIQGNNDAVHPNLRGALLSIVLKYGGEKELHQVIDLYKKSTLQEQKIQALASLCSIQQPELISALLNFALTDDVRSQDVPFVFSHLGGNAKARKITWTFLQEKWKVIYDKFYGGSFLLGRIISSVCGCHTTDAMAHEIEAFFAKFPPADIAAIDKEILQSLEKVRANAQWVKNDGKNTAAWLKEQGY